MDWDIENEVLRLENMIIVYQEHIDKLEEENEELRREIDLLKNQLLNILPNGNETD